MRQKKLRGFKRKSIGYWIIKESPSLKKLLKRLKSKIYGKVPKGEIIEEKIFYS